TIRRDRGTGAWVRRARRRVPGRAGAGHPRLGATAPMRHRAGAGALALALLVVGGAASPDRLAVASIEEFSTFDVVAKESANGSVTDHEITAFPIEWRDEWEHTGNGFRPTQGCLTSALWLMDTQLRAGSPLGRRARFELVLDQNESDRASWNHLEL